MVQLVVLDRDGVINQTAPGGYVLDPDNLVLEPGAAQAIALLNDRNVKVVVATNQSPVGRGWITEEELQSIHVRLQNLLQDYGAHIDAFYCAFDHPDDPTHRRKPAPGMLLEALEDFEAGASMTPFIGDTFSDMKAADAAGCLPHFVLTGHGAEEKKHVEKTFPEAIIHTNLLAASSWLMEHHFD